MVDTKVMALKRTYSPSSGLVKFSFRPQDDAAVTAALALTSAGGPPPSVPEDPPETLRITSTGDERVTSDGSPRIIG